MMIKERHKLYTADVRNTSHNLVIIPNEMRKALKHMRDQGIKKEKSRIKSIYFSLRLFVL